MFYSLNFMYVNHLPVDAQHKTPVLFESICFRLHLLSEEEKGAAFAIFKDGELVVDLWGGYADIEAWQPWKKSTVANTFSLYTMAASLSLGLLHERYLLGTSVLAIVLQ